MTTETTAPATGDAAQPAASDATAAAAAAAQGTTAAAPDSQAASTDGADSAVKEGEQQKDAGEEAKAPETYDLKAPEGIELEPAALEEFTAIAKELKLSGENAQKLADIAVKMQQRQAEKHVATVKEWADQSKTDKEFGGDAFGENVAVARKAIETFGSPELKSLLDATGMGNHPEVIRAFFKAGKAISEGKFVASGARTATPAQSTAKALYPDMN